MWESRFKVDLTANSNLFLEILTLHLINWYVWQRTHLCRACVRPKTENHGIDNNIIIPSSIDIKSK